MRQSECLSKATLLLLAILTRVAMGSGTQPSDTSPVPAFSLPPSGYLSTESQAVLQRSGISPTSEEYRVFTEKCPLKKTVPQLATRDEINTYRECLDKYLWPPMAARQKARYKVSIEPAVIGGVPTDVFMPADGVSNSNRNRVLINVPGSAFFANTFWIRQIESVPIAAMGKIKVVSVNHRLAPEHRFPAGSDDIVAVYKALLADHKPQDVGIYGNSSGAFITAETVASLLKQGIPVPGAVGMFCGAAWPGGRGDSDHLLLAMSGGRSRTSKDSVEEGGGISYFSGEDLRNPLAFPGPAPDIMARFPGALLISATRDFLLSSVLVTHAHLVRLGVDADLHVWEGLGHGFFYEPDLAESREAYDVIVRFFDERLGTR